MTRAIKGTRSGDNGDSFVRNPVINWKTVATNITTLVIIGILSFAFAAAVGGESSNVSKIEFINHEKYINQRLVDIEKRQTERYETLLREIKKLE